MTTTERAARPRKPGKRATLNSNNLFSFMLLTAALATLMLQAGCIGLAGANGGTNPTNGTTAPQLNANPSSLSFGSVSVGASSTQTITLSNPGNATLLISQSSIGGTGFTIVSGSSSLSIPAGQSQTVSIKFTPVAAGNASGTITFTSNVSGTPLSVPLSGVGLAATSPALVALPSAVNYGVVVLGSPDAQSITIQNAGTSSLTITQAVVAGSGFTITGLPLPMTLPAGTNATFNAVFSPMSSANVSGTISLTNNSPTSPYVITLNGTGAQGLLSANPSTVSFGSVSVGGNTSQTVTLSNSGAGSTTVTQITANGTGFSYSGIQVPFTLGAGQNTSFTAKFAPTSSGAAVGNLTFVSSAPNSPSSIALNGTGTQSGISATPSSVNFGNVTVGSPNSQTIQLSNTGSSSLTITQATVAGTGYSISGLALPATIPAGGNTTFNVSFGPASGGSVSGSVSIVSNAPNSPLAIPLSGTGIATTKLLGASASNLAFGNVSVGSNSSQNVVLTNNGNTTVTVTGVSTTGTGYGSSGISVNQTIAAGQSATLSVTFTPPSAATFNGNVTISSDATNSPVSIPLSGTGTQAAVAHSVTLTWTASTSTVVGYNVYRSTVSGGPYTLITSSPVPGTTFTDTTVQAGVTYFYVVTAVDASGNESVFSNEASTTVPTP